MSVTSIPRSHWPIRELVARIREETGEAVPDTSSRGPGIEAQVLIVLRDPGRLGALKTQELSPLTNSDQTAKNQRALFKAAGLDPLLCLFWNAVPWDLKGKKPSASDVKRGAGYLSELIALFPQHPTVVACGNEAHAACRIAGLTEAIQICHPGMQALNRYPQNRRKHIEGLREAAARADLHQASAP